MLVFSLIAVAFSSMIFVPALAESCTRTYIVRDGDTCDSISAADNVSTYQLAVVNSEINANCSNLTPGETLCLGTPGKDCTHTYVVKSNDDCDIVSSANNINTTILFVNNPQLNSDCLNMYIGEVLCVAGTVIVAPAPPGGKTPPPTMPSTATPARHTSSESEDDLPWCE